MYFLPAFAWTKGRKSLKKKKKNDMPVPPSTSTNIENTGPDAKNALCSKDINNFIDLLNNRINYLESELVKLNKIISENLNFICHYLKSNTNPCTYSNLLKNNTPYPFNTNLYTNNNQQNLNTNSNNNTNITNTDIGKPRQDIQHKDNQHNLNSNQVSNNINNPIFKFNGNNINDTDTLTKYPWHLVASRKNNKMHKRNVDGSIKLDSSQIPSYAGVSKNLQKTRFKHNVGSAENCELQPAKNIGNKKLSLYLTKVDVNQNVDTIRNYLNKRNIKIYGIFLVNKKIPEQYRVFNSFKIDVSEECFEIINNSSFWPKGIDFDAWIDYGKNHNNQLDLINLSLVPTKKKLLEPEPSSQPSILTNEISLIPSIITEPLDKPTSDTTIDIDLTSNNPPVVSDNTVSNWANEMEHIDLANIQNHGIINI